MLHATCATRREKPKGRAGERTSEFHSTTTPGTRGPDTPPGDDLGFSRCRWPRAARASTLAHVGQRGMQRAGSSTSSRACSAPVLSVRLYGFAFYISYLYLMKFMRHPSLYSILVLSCELYECSADV
eukprot:scaffold18427_cov61-Phaeocystis_antarctica.AAC.11